MTIRHLIRTLIATAVLFAALPASAWAAGQTSAANAGEILVGVRADAWLAPAASALSAQLGPVAQTDNVRVMLLKTSTEKMAMTLSQLRDDPAVLWAEPNGVVSGAFIPNDPYFSDRNKVYAPQQIKADLAWDVARGSAGILVAVVDSGIDFSHPDLAGIFWSNSGEVAANNVDDDGNGLVDDVVGWDFVNKDNAPTDDQGHGTHVSGIIAAGLNNGIGIAGIAAGVKIMPVKVLNGANQGTWADVAAGIIYAADHGAAIINLSLGGITPSQTIAEAVAYAQSRGALVVAAAGNAATDQPFYPAAYLGVLAVAATAPNNTRWTLSNYGSYIAVSAPGATVYSTYWSAAAGSTYQFLSGTSMAAPTAAAVAALVLSINPTLTALQVTDILTKTAMDLGAAGRDDYFGYGQVDAYAAALQAQASLPPSGVISGFAWIDQNGNSSRDLNETQGIVGVSIQTANAQGEVVGQTMTQADGSYAFTGLTVSSYTVRATTPQGYLSTTPTQKAVVLAYGQASITDFGFVVPTGVTLQAMSVTPQRQQLVVAWEISGGQPDQGWRVLRASGPTGTPKNITAQPVFGTPAAANLFTSRFEDTGVLAGQTYWYWVENIETGEQFGPQAGTASSGAVYIAYILR
jgi:thermitase